MHVACPKGRAHLEGVSVLISSQMLNGVEINALSETLDDEYKSQETYAQVIRDFGEVRPFINIVMAEARHAVALLNLFEK